jgi:carboxypeptidase PM20D1
MKKLLLLLLGAVVALLAAAVAHTLAITPTRPAVNRAEGPAIALEAAEARLGEALQFRTESLVATIADGGAEFDRFHAFLERSFPRVHAQLQREKVNRFSLLYTWPGRNPALKPVLLMCHQDVVPIAPGTEKDWRHPPYSGAIVDGEIWGRGALDVKSGLLAQLEAAELLLAAGWQPERTVYFAFGHDEEIGGSAGAARIAALLHSRRVELECVLDEGGAVTLGVLPFTRAPVALVGIAEKGYVTLTLDVKTEPGHSSMPGKTSAIGILSRAIVRLEEDPFPADLAHQSRMLRGAAPAIDFAPRVLLTNPWLFGPLVERVLAAKPTTDAGIRTTTAPTILSAGNKDNVLPGQAHAKVNFRILPPAKIEDVLARVRRVIDDPRVTVAIDERFSSEPSPISDTESASYRALERSIYEALPEPGAVVAPYLVMGGTDSRHFTGLTRNVYRFLFNRLTPETLATAHGTNERISVANYGETIGFYRRFLQAIQAAE